jgi:hypothetical protein
LESLLEEGDGAGSCDEDGDGADDEEVEFAVTAGEGGGVAVRQIKKVAAWACACGLILILLTRWGAKMLLLKEVNSRRDDVRCADGSRAVITSLCLCNC